MDEKSLFRPDFDRLDRQTPGAAPAWLESLRHRASERFEAVGFPVNKQEEWRHTNVAAIAKVPFRPAGPTAAGATEAVRRFGFGSDAACELVFVNGHFDAKLSRTSKLPRGIRVVTLTDALASDAAGLEPYLGQYADIAANPFVALNTGFLGGGAFIHLARGATLEQPIHVLHLSAPGGEPSVSHPRLLVVAEEASQATIVESYAAAGRGMYFTNAVTEIATAANAVLDHYKLQQESSEAFHVATMQVRVDRSGSFVSHNASIGSKLARNDLNVVLAGQGASATLNGLVLIDAEQHVDNHTLLDHAAPNCPSHELYKHVLNGRATGVFRGKILVRQAAQKTDSKQTSKALLLSNEAFMNSQPALEIYADDVKCTHGSTTGPVDEDQVFYLRTRGVGLDSARHLLTYAFAADITRRIKVEPVRRRLEDYMSAKAGLPQDLRISDLGSHDDAVVNL